MVVVVPIGFRCMTSMALRHFGFQQQSLPFDWMGASLSAITAAISDDLRAMLAADDIEPFLDIGLLTEQNRTVVNKYGMACTHVFKKKLTGREQAPPSCEEWQGFITTMRQKFPSLRFRILYIQVGSKAPSVPADVKLLVGNYPIVPVGGKFDDPTACCPEVIRSLVTNLCRKLERNI